MLGQTIEVEPSDIKDPLPENTVFSESGTLCYLWNVDSDNVTLDIVYSYGDDGDMEYEAFHTRETIFSRASAVNGNDIAIQNLVKSAIVRKANKELELPADDMIFFAIKDNNNSICF